LIGGIVKSPELVAPQIQDECRRRVALGQSSSLQQS
jgi:hypothetical protein